MTGGRRAALAATVLLGGAAVVLAHSFDPALLDLREREPGRFDVVWKSPAAARPGLGPTPEPVLPGHCRQIGGVTAPADDPGVLKMFHVDCGATGLHGASIAVAGIAGSNIDVVLRIRWADGDVTTGVLRSGSEAITVPGVHGGLPLASIFRRYGALGIEHILSGPDHLLFLLALVLLVRGWRQLTLTITAFTAAHSVSLALAVLGIVHLPSGPVEALIAASIVPVALEALRPPGAPPTLISRAPWLAAFCFGLLHGLGFASALTELGLPHDHLPAALASFNLGVEAGQLAVVALVLLPVRWLQRQPRWVQAAPAYTIAAVAMAWTIERVGACL